MKRTHTCSQQPLSREQSTHTTSTHGFRGKDQPLLLLMFLLLLPLAAGELGLIKLLQLLLIRQPRLSSLRHRGGLLSQRSL